MFKRLFCVLILCHGLGLPWAFSQTLSDEEQAKNVVLFLIDDLGWKDLGCQGSDYYQTPNIDRLAKRGARFTNAYAACAVCSPTRAAVLTGKAPRDCCSPRG